MQQAGSWMLIAFQHYDQSNVSLGVATTVVGHQEGKNPIHSSFSDTLRDF